MAYATRSDIGAIFGRPTIARWADLANDGIETNIAERISTALSSAENQVNDALRGGAYAIPFATVPACVTEITAKLAGVWLFEGRGILEEPEDNEEAAKLITRHKDQAGQALDMIHSGLTQLSVAPAGVHYPEVVTDDD